MQAVILAAGRGKRLHPITENRTKAMAPIVGKPIVERVMDSLIANGIREFVLVTDPNDIEITGYFQKESKIDAHILFVPQSEPLGMGHALLQAAPYIAGDFILSSCDNLAKDQEIKELLAIWEDRKPNAILTTLRVGPPEITRMGIVALDGEWVTRIVEKPMLAEAPSDIGSVPLYVFSSRLLKYLGEIKPSPRGEYELQDAIQLLIERDGMVRHFELTGRTDLTTPQDLLALNLQYLTNGSFQGYMFLENVGENTRFISPVWIEKSVTIGSNCKIGPNVYIEHGCTIGDGVCLEDVVVLRNRMVGKGRIEKGKVIW